MQKKQNNIDVKSCNQLTMIGELMHTTAAQFCTMKISQIVITVSFLSKGDEIFTNPIIFNKTAVQVLIFYDMLHQPI